MEMKKIACGVLFAAASMTAVMALDINNAMAPVDMEAPAPAPAASAASVALPALGSLVGASLVSLFSYYLH
ncbi:unnamed protein product [Arabis nemorensis]|uniref:Arabinogalactan peptide 23-like n=1 Tax=Arabis nemorensis TaxID=586526 RepID=A0A565BXK5_9BRAS|nr:unnamed protein product [Arabis nemorensis]